MLSKTSSNINVLTEPASKVISDTTDLHSPTLLELMDSIDGGKNIEFKAPKVNITFNQTDFN
jgi:hypothetical protein